MGERQSFFLPQLVLPPLRLPGVDSQAQQAIDQALQDLRQQTQTYLQQLAARVDTLAGLRGTPTLYADQDLQGHQVQHLGAATTDTDAVMRGQTVYMEAGGQHFTASGLGIRHLAPAEEDTQAVILSQLRAGLQSVDVHTAQFVVLALTPALTNERRLVIETNVLSLTDAGANNTITAGVAANGITDAKLRQGTALTVIGRSANSTGNVADIAASADGQVLRRAAGLLAFGAVDLADTDAVTGVLAVANGGTGTGSAGPVLASGVYTPTLTNVANVSANAAFPAQYLRVGSVVTVSGFFNVTPAVLATATQIDLSLPVASNLAQQYQAAGVAIGVAAGEDAALYGDVANDRLSCAFTSLGIVNATMCFHCSYQVI